MGRTRSLWKAKSAQAKMEILVKREESVIRCKSKLTMATATVVLAVLGVTVIYAQNRTQERASLVK